jgi:hypothetical protein
MNYKYIIVDANDIHQINFGDVVEENIRKARWNRNKSKVLLKFINKCPRWYLRKPIYEKYQIKHIINNGLW